MGRMDTGSLAQQGVNDLVLLAVRRQDQRCDIVREPVQMYFFLLKTHIDLTDCPNS